MGTQDPAPPPVHDRRHVGPHGKAHHPAPQAEQPLVHNHPRRLEPARSPHATLTTPPSDPTISNTSSAVEPTPTRSACGTLSHPHARIMTTRPAATLDRRSAGPYERSRLVRRPQRAMSLCGAWRRSVLVTFLRLPPSGLATAVGRARVRLSTHYRIHQNDVGARFLRRAPSVPGWAAHGVKDQRRAAQ